MLILMISKSFNNTYTHTLTVCTWCLNPLFMILTLLFCDAQCTMHQRKWNDVAFDVQKVWIFNAKIRELIWHLCPIFVGKFDFFLWASRSRVDFSLFRVFLSHLELSMMKRNMLEINVMPCISLCIRCKPSEKSNFSKFRMRFYCVSFHLLNEWTEMCIYLVEFSFVRQTEVDHAKTA